MDRTDWFRRIAEAAADGIWVIDLDGCTVDVNPAVERLLRRTRAELVGQPLGDLLDDVGRAQHETHLADLRMGRVDPMAVECLFHRPDGTPVWTVVRKGLLTHEDGTGEAVVLTVVDNRERKQLLDELTGAQRLAADTERLARLGSWTWTADEGFEVSDGIRALYGDRADQVFASIQAFFAALHPDDRQRVYHSLEDSASAFDFETRVRVQSGWIWIRGRGLFERDSDGRLLRARGTHQDITRARDTDDALQDLVTQNSFMQAVASAANEARTFDEVLALAKEVVLLHDDWERARGFVPGPDGMRRFHIDEPDRIADEQASDPKLLRIEQELADRCAGETRPVWDDEQRLTLAFPVLLDDELIAVIVVTSRPPLFRHDMIESMASQVAEQLARVADRERSALALAEARDRAMDASRHKSEFLAIMSHEIRTPLNGIVGLAELLGRTGLDDRQRHLLAGVDLSSRSLLAIVNDILDFSKIEAGRLELEDVDYDIREVLDQAAGVLADGARAKGLDLTVSCGPDVPEVKRGDPTRLLQVLTNLGSNAIKFTSSGEVSFRTSTVHHDGHGPRLRVEVRDQGIGIAPDRLPAIFQAFSQADTSTTRRFGGTGLGLAISREIVEAKGGDIGVISEPGHGSLFWFEVPLTEAKSETQVASTAQAREHLRGMRVLAVDDVETNRQILTEQLAWWQVGCRAVATAGEALTALAEAEYDLVVLDMAMPEVDGLTLATAIRRVTGADGPPMVLLSSQLPLDDATLEAHGISACLLKPVSSAVLRDVLLRVREPVSAPSRAEVAARRSSHRVLVVEDNQVNRVVATGFLDSLGYTADLAEDGMEAITAVERTPYDLIIMDLQMPRLDGYGATRAIRSRERALRLERTPIVAMTAAAIEGERDRAYASGMDDFVTKPVSRARLAEVLARWLEDEGDEGSAAVSAASEYVVSVGDALDRARLSELAELDDEAAYLRRAAASFGTRAPGLLADVAAVTEDPTALDRAAHSLRGAASNIGLPRVADLAGELERLARVGRTADTALVAELERAMAEAVAALEEYVATLPNP